MWEGGGKQTNSALLDPQPKIFSKSSLEVRADIDDVILVKYQRRSRKHAVLLQLKTYCNHLGTKLRAVLLSQYSSCQSNEVIRQKVTFTKSTMVSTSEALEQQFQLIMRGTEIMR